MPTERYVRRCFEELQVKIARIDHNHILSRYLWHEKGFIGFMKLGDEIGYDEAMDLACSVAVRENARCNKPRDSIKTWAYFKNDMAVEL